MTLIICDTHVLIFWAIVPRELSRSAKQALEGNLGKGTLACSDISLWEIAMLESMGKVDLGGIDSAQFSRAITKALNMQIHAISPEIAYRAYSPGFAHGDPADRLIAATALHYNAPLITKDRALRNVPGLQAIW